jgi:hypothetical protein
MAQSTPTRKGSPTKADYRTVDPFHAFAVIGRSLRDLLVKFNIIKPRPSKHTAKSSKREKHRH